jgi:hypothetical protein
MTTAADKLIARELAGGTEPTMVTAGAGSSDAIYAKARRGRRSTVANVKLATRSREDLMSQDSSAVNLVFDQDFRLLRGAQV